MTLRNSGDAVYVFLDNVMSAVKRYEEDQAAEKLQQKLWDDSQLDLLDVNKSHWMKSCPECSRRAGKVVFLPYPSAFGESEKRDTQTHHGAQSWCHSCRSRGRHEAGRIQEA